MCIYIYIYIYIHSVYSLGLRWDPGRESRGWRALLVGRLTQRRWRRTGVLPGPAARTPAIAGEREPQHERRVLRRLAPRRLRREAPRRSGRRAVRRMWPARRRTRGVPLPGRRRGGSPGELCRGGPVRELRAPHQLVLLLAAVLRPARQGARHPRDRLPLHLLSGINK